MFKYPIGPHTKSIIKSFLLERRNDTPSSDQNINSEENKETDEEKARREAEENFKKDLERFNQKTIDDSPFKEVPVGDDVKKLNYKGDVVNILQRSDPAEYMGVGGTNTSGRGGRGSGVPAHPRVKDVVDTEKIGVGEYSRNVLFGPSSDNIGDDFDTLVMQPYRELQYAKLARAYTPELAQKIKAASDIPGAGRDIGGSISATTGQGYRDAIRQNEALRNADLQRILNKAKNSNQKDKIDTMVKHLSLDKKMLEDLAEKDPTYIDEILNNELQQVASLNAPDDDRPSGSAKRLNYNIKRSVETLKGMGGLDPFFTKELSAKLRGGEWVEKMTRELGSSQERGVMSSIGNVKSALSGF